MGVGRREKGGRKVGRRVIERWGEGRKKGGEENEVWARGRVECKAVEGRKSIIGYERVWKTGAREWGREENGERN